MRQLLLPALLVACLCATAQEPKSHVVSGDPARVERVRKAKMPALTKPVMFDTPEADVILSALEVFPEDNPWNLVVSDWPLHPKSKEIVASIGLILGIYTRPVAVLTGLFLLVASWASWRVSAGKWMWNFGGAEYPLFWSICCFETISGGEDAMVSPA